MNRARKRALEAWTKVAKRGFTKVICPPFLEDVVLDTLKESCLQGDVNSCRMLLQLDPSAFATEI